MVRQAIETLNEKARERMAAWRLTEGYREWLENSRELRRALKEKYRRERGVPSRAEQRAAREAAKAQKEAERVAWQADARSHVEAWQKHLKAVERAAKKSQHKEDRLTYERASELLAYDAQTGVLTWRINYSKAVAGSVAGCIKAAGYLVIGIGGEKYMAHRVAWLLTHGAWPSQSIDHIDGNRANNRLANLRDVPHKINAQNKRQPSKTNKAGMLGVHFRAKDDGWFASITADGKRKRWGPYKTAEQAQAKYIEMKRLLHEGCTI